MDAVVFLLLILLIDKGIISKLRARLAALFTREQPAESSELDDDVNRERGLVKNCLATRDYTENILLVHELEKTFGKLRAVDKLSFGVRAGECFGLLGVNGAGKTTTFKMLTGDEAAGGGRTVLMGFDLSTHRTEFLRNIGYCPQFDSILTNLTGVPLSIVQVAFISHALLIA